MRGPGEERFRGRAWYLSVECKTVFGLYEIIQWATTLTSNWKPLRPFMLGGAVRNVPYGEVVNSTNSSAPDA